MYFFAIKNCSIKNIHKIRSKKLPEIMFLSLCWISRLSRPDYPAVPPLNPIAWVLWEGKWERDWKKTGTLKFKSNFKNLELAPHWKLWCVLNTQTLETEKKSPKTQPSIPIKPCIHLRVLWNHYKILLKEMRCLKWELPAFTDDCCNSDGDEPSLFLNLFKIHSLAHIYRTETSKNVVTDVPLFWNVC